MIITRMQWSLRIAFLLAISVAGVGVAPMAAQGQVEGLDVPVIMLDAVEGGFFVLTSAVPFRVSKADTGVDWFDVEAVEGEATEPRIVSLSSYSADLTPGIHYGAVHIDLTTPEGSRLLSIPVALDVPGESQGENALTAVTAGVPEELVQLSSGQPSVEVRFGLTPARHVLIEVVDLQQEQNKLEAMTQSTSLIAGAATQTYEHVFPWMCLDVCGAKLANEIADVAPNLDAVSSVSYERYSMHFGRWGVPYAGDPGPWLSENGVGKWPMLIGGYKPAAASIGAMWTNRATILQNMIAEADANGYLGYVIDVEGGAESGRTTFIALMDYLADGMHAKGYKLMVAHATWATLAPLSDLAATSVDYVATMDPYTGWWYKYIPADYAAIDHPRLIWGFTWGGISDATQLRMWDWMEVSGYNVDVAGAAVWETPLMPPHGSNTLDYYAGLRRYYPKVLPAVPTPTDTPEPTATLPTSGPTSTPTATATPTSTFTPTATSLPPEEAIANSDFEQGFALMGGGYIANGWAEWEYNPGAITGYDEAVAVHGGAHSQRLRVWKAGGGSGGVYQQIPVSPGSSYTVSVQTRALDTLAFCSLGVDPSGGTDPRSGVIWSSSSRSPSWVEETWTGTATSNSITVYLRAASVESSKRNCYFDDVTLVLGPATTPPPEEAIANSGFEQGFSLMGGGYIANRWAEWEYNPGAITGYDEAVTVHGGAHSQRLRVWKTGGGSGGVYQQVPVTAGSSYSVSVQTSAMDTLAFCSLGVDPSGGTDSRSGVIWSSTSNSASWVQKTWTGTATSDSITIYFRAAAVDSGKRNCYFDDVTLVPDATVNLGS